MPEPTFWQEDEQAVSFWLAPATPSFGFTQQTNPKAYGFQRFHIVVTPLPDRSLRKMFSEANRADRRLPHRITPNTVGTNTSALPEDITGSLHWEQTGYVNTLKPIDQVKKGAQICFYSLRNLYQKGGISWWNPQIIEENVKRFGDRFIKSLSKTTTFSKEFFEIVNDPRNDLLGEAALKKLKKLKKA